VDPSWFDQGPINLGAKVGIAIGGVVVLLMALGCFVVWRGKRRRRAFLRTIGMKPHGRNGWPASPPQPQGEMFETPVSQRPLRGGWDDSPMSAHTDGTFPRYFSPYSSQYNSPVSAQDAPPTQWSDASFAGAQNIGVALGGHDGQNQWGPAVSDTKGKGKGMDDGSYEMHEVDSAGSGASFRERQRARQQQQYFQQQQQQQQQQRQHSQAPVLAHPGFGRTSESPPRRYDLTDQDRNGRP
jgi:hypothetical protein